MTKKSVRIAPDDEKSLIADPSPMPVNEAEFYTVEMQREGMPTATPSDEQSQSPQQQRYTLSDTQPDSVSEEKASDKNDDDNDDEFDWNDDPDQPRPCRRKTTRQRIQEAMRRPCCWSYLSPMVKRAIYAVTGSCLLVAAAVCVNTLLPVPTEEQRKDPNFKNVRSNLQCWLYWAAFQWHIAWLTIIVVESVPRIVSMWTKMFKGRRSERVKSSMEYYMSLKGYLTLLFLASWNWGSWAFLIQYPYSSVGDQPYSDIVTRVFACIFVLTCWLFGQKTVIQIIALRFHHQAFSDRLQQNKYALKVLDTLSKAESRKSRQELHPNLRNRRSGGIELSDPNAEEGHSTSVHGPDTRRPHATELLGQFQKRIHGIVLTDQPQVRSRMERHKVDINSTEHAKKVAKKLFYSLAFPHVLVPPEVEAKATLDFTHFKPYFNTTEEARNAFAVFDQDGNGSLTRREFRDTVLRIYKERKALAQSTRDTSQALGKIDNVLLLISILATILISLAIFKVDFWQSLVPIGSFLLALTFVFGNSCKNIFESVMFIFVTHPFDTGDYLLIDNQFLLVHEMGLMGTVFIRGDGQMVYAPTTVLMTKLIVNVRRSGNMGESIVLNIDFRTPTEQLYLLKDRLTEWVANESKDYAPGFDVRVTDIVDVNQIILTIWLPHKGNWQDLGKRFQRRTKFMIAVKDIFTELGIRYELPAQRFTQAPTDQTFLKPSPSPEALMQVTPQSFAQQI